MRVRLFVLGVAYEHETHGYEIKALAKLWGLDEWAKIGFGSIYHAFGALEKEGALVQHETVQSGNRPPRTTYRITPLGREAFLPMLRDALRDPGSAREDVDLALAFAANLPSEERAPLLRERLDGLRVRQARGEARLVHSRATYSDVPWISASLEHAVALLRAEIDWTTSLAERIAEFPPRDWSRIKL